MRTGLVFCTFVLLLANAGALQLPVPAVHFSNVTAELESLDQLPKCLNDTGCKDSCGCQDFQVGKICASKTGVFVKGLSCDKCESDGDCAQGDTCAPGFERCVTCMSAAIKESNKNCQIGAPPCIETRWLRAQVLEHAVLRHAGPAQVLCPPGLPCGTPGHLLRECNGAECILTSYRNACARRGDCVSSVTQVSQLSHAHDWSEYSIPHSSSSLSLTSLSAHPEAKQYSTSMLVARATDALNRHGLGRVSNTVAMQPYHFRMRLTALRAEILGAGSVEGSSSSCQVL